MLRRTLLSASLAAPLSIAGLAGTPALAQERRWRLVVGFAPGSAPDFVARALTQQLGAQWTVDSRTGAGGQIATNSVAKADGAGAEGLLLLGEVGSIAIAPAAFSRLPYDPTRELAIVTEAARTAFVLVVPHNSPARDLAAFVEAARASRERVLMATFGAGTPGHFGIVSLAEQAGFGVEPVHYRATGEALTALVAGDVRGALVSTAAAIAQVRGGTLRALATTAAQRAPQLAEVPTFAEAGFPRMDQSSWFAVFAPAATPAATLDALNREIVAALQTAALRTSLQEMGFRVIGSSRADAQRMWQAEAQRWAAVVRATGFRGD